MATATLSKKKAAPPKPKPRKASPINAEYEAKAKALLRYAMEIKGFSIESLTAGLNDMGVEISAGGVANKISHGGFSAAVFIQCMTVMDVNLAPSLK